MSKLRNSGFKFVKNYGNREIWEKNNKQLMVPLSDNISGIHLKRLMDQIQNF